MLNGITGSVGLGPTLAALRSGAVLALANKESLVAGGALVTGAAAPGQIVPVDSEHSALAQCLRGGRAEEVDRLVVTASGGPFRGRTRAELADVTVEQALAHPTWDMGPVITVNSATLINKGLEVIEAHLLFGIPYDRIDVTVHPQSIVHSMVTFTDGSTLAQASPPDMALPIGLALAWPERLPGAATAVPLGHRRRPGPSSRSTTTRSPASGWPARPGRPPGAAVPAVLNAANEEAVAAFVSGRAAVHRHHRRPRPGARRRRRVGARSRYRGGRAGRGGLGPRPRPGPRPPIWSDHMMTVLGIVIFFLGILFSVAWHELGHFTTAKWFGIKVPEFFVGFGKTVWSRRRGETEFGLKLIPLGGYIRMIGMIPPAKGELLGSSRRTGPFQGLIDDVRRQSATRWLPGRRRPPVLDAGALEARDRDVRRPVHEPRPRGGAVRRSS